MGISAHRSGFRLMLWCCALSLLFFVTSSCGDGKLREYLTADSLIYGNVPVYVDSTGSAEVTIRTDFGYPEMVVYYSCEEYDLRKLKTLDADLIIDGKVIEADKVSRNASYANTSVDLANGASLDSLSEKLGITDSSSYMESFTAGLQLVKTYSSVKEFPKQLSVRLTSETTSGNSDSTIVYSLRVSKDTRAPIRVH